MRRIAIGTALWFALMGSAIFSAGVAQAMYVDDGQPVGRASSALQLTFAAGSCTPAATDDGCA
jgi:type II secretory pathway component PulC